MTILGLAESFKAMNRPDLARPDHYSLLRPISEKA